MTGRWANGPKIPRFRSRRDEKVSAGIRHHALACLGKCLLRTGNLGVQLWGLAVASCQRIVQLVLRIGEKLVGRSGFGSAPGHSGNAGLRARRGGVVFAARDDQRFVAVGACAIDVVVERDARIAHPLQGARCLHDSGR